MGRFSRVVGDGKWELGNHNMITVVPWQIDTLGKTRKPHNETATPFINIFPMPLEQPRLAQTVLNQNFMIEVPRYTSDHRLHLAARTEEHEYPRIVSNQAGKAGDNFCRVGLTVPRITL